MPSAPHGRISTYSTCRLCRRSLGPTGNRDIPASSCATALKRGRGRGEAEPGAQLDAQRHIVSSPTAKVSKLLSAGPQRVSVQARMRSAGAASRATAPSYQLRGSQVPIPSNPAPELASI